jgi:diguanylate cyclase
MKALIREAYHSDHVLELLFSSVRWLFLIVSGIVFSFQYSKSPSQIVLVLFLLLFVFACIYMGITEFYLRKSVKGSKMYKIWTKGGPLFDCIAFTGLIPLTGGIDSPLIPLAYVIILHITVYWRFKGGIISAILFSLIYSIIFFTQAPDAYSSHSLITYLTQVLFFVLVGGLGGIIVSRERIHHFEKNLLATAANVDYLTKLLNHRSFQEHLRKDIDRGAEFYLALTDIDWFKSINDKYGHIMGDKVLSQIGSIFTSIITEKDGKVFRYGGEEFAILFYHHDQALVNKLLVEIKDCVANCVFNCVGEAFSVTMSFGCCKYKGEVSDQLVERTDKLLYEAKHRGRNMIIFENQSSCVEQEVCK